LIAQRDNSFLMCTIPQSGNFLWLKRFFIRFC
jgi:hypothetical protein